VHEQPPAEPLCCEAEAEAAARGPGLAPIAVPRCHCDR
jgi:hypothetical protein